MSFSRVSKYYLVLWRTTCNSPSLALWKAKFTDKCPSHASIFDNLNSSLSGNPNFRVYIHNLVFSVVNTTKILLNHQSMWASIHPHHIMRQKRSSLVIIYKITKNKTVHAIKQYIRNHMTTVRYNSHVGCVRQLFRTNQIYIFSFKTDRNWMYRVWGL